MIPPQRHNASTRRGSRRDPAGFTLIETALAIVIVGVGILAMMAGQQAWHYQNDWAQQVGLAARLGNEIREMTMQLRHDPVGGPSPGVPKSMSSDSRISTIWTTSMVMVEV